MQKTILCLLLFITTLLPISAQKPLDGTSASRWKPCLSWVPEHARTKIYSVDSENGLLVFRGEGAGTQLPWLISLTADEIAGDTGYMLIRYKAEGLFATGDYFLHGVEGTPGGRQYAASDEVISDGNWHMLAVDLAKVVPLEPTSQIGIKLIVGDSSNATLTVEKIWFSNDLPDGATIARVNVVEPQVNTFHWRDAQPDAQPGWTTIPAAEYSAKLNDDLQTFNVRGENKAMRWSLTLPTPVDLITTPYMSLSYKATGNLGLATYAVWLGNNASGSGGSATIPMFARDIKADGQWHTFSYKIADQFSATQLAIGLDSLQDEATFTLGSITFSSTPLRWSVSALLPHEIRQSSWSAGDENFTTLAPESITGGLFSRLFTQRLEISDWFTDSEITVDQIPFRVFFYPEKMPLTGTAEFGELQLPLPSQACEIYLLTAVAAPATEPFGIDSMHPRPQEVISEPEKMTCEIRYETGPSDYILPVGMTSGQWGLRRGLGVHVVHPDPARKPVELLLHDHMQTASFAILGATVNTGEPHVKAPGWEHLQINPTTSKYSNSLPTLQVEFNTNGPLTWSDFCIANAPDALSCAQGPVFEVEIGAKILPNESWEIINTDKTAGQRFTLQNSEANLTAVVEWLPDNTNGILLRMSLQNDAPEQQTATLRFPILKQVRLGTVADTNYLFGKRGGIINSKNVSYREPLGDCHPLQVDGFFNPQTGLALSCMTHDTVAQHHFINMAKTAGGGQWAPEYVERDLAPNAIFKATEAALSVHSGDWRAIFETYKNWLATWYQLPQAKPWWERTYAFMGCNSHHYDTATIEQRTDLQGRIDNALEHLGVCDYIHLYGVWASKEFGEWGDYNHYEETVGGLERFRDIIAQIQAKGIGVGTYQDGYLNCDTGKFTGEFAEQWAMKTVDGKPNFVGEFGAYNECPYNSQWQDYLVDVYRRLSQDFKMQGLYIDEFGATDGRWICHAKDHGHNGYEIPYAGEVQMLQKIRDAVGPQTALYTEYPSAEVMRQILDGSFTYQALWSVDQESLAPHFIDLPRFAFPKFKQFHIIYYVTPRAGNWWLLKYPFFNGESYDISEPGIAYFDDAALAFQRRAVEVLCAHREAFSSDDVTPLVPTEVAGVFANRFNTSTETVWTIYNANGRSVHDAVLKIPYDINAKYENAWAGTALEPEVRGEEAYITVPLGPKGIGCVIEHR